MKHTVLFIFFTLMICSCGITYNTSYSFKEIPRHQQPDYSKHEHWAALPFKKDYADEVPTEHLKDQQTNSKTDVFFVHPTTFGEQQSPEWNANIDDSITNYYTDFWAIRHQASIFNNVGKIYAPRYRQAHIKSYYHLEEGGKDAILLAYADIKKAFEYYLEHYNQGRPFIIAAHSQGSTHASFLIRDYIDKTPLADKMIAAYLVGMSIKKDQYENIPPCLYEHQINCFVSWQTYSEGYLPEDSFDEYRENAFAINPISWSVDEDYSNLNEHKGLLMYNFKTVYKRSLKAKVNKKKNIVWITQPKVPFAFLLKRKNYHVADYNLYWFNIRENAALRVEEYFK